MKLSQEVKKIETYSISEKEKKPFEFKFLFWHFKNVGKLECKLVWNFGKKRKEKDYDFRKNS